MPLYLVQELSSLVWQRSSQPVSLLPPTSSMTSQCSSNTKLLTTLLTHPLTHVLAYNGSHTNLWSLIRCFLPTYHRLLAGCHPKLSSRMSPLKCFGAASYWDSSGLTYTAFCAYLYDCIYHILLAHPVWVFPLGGVPQEPRPCLPHLSCFCTSCWEVLVAVYRTTAPCAWQPKLGTTSYP